MFVCFFSTCLYAFEWDWYCYSLPFCSLDTTTWMGPRSCFSDVDGKANDDGGEQEDGLKPVAEPDGVCFPLGTLIHVFPLLSFASLRALFINHPGKGFHCIIVRANVDKKEKDRTVCFWNSNSVLFWIQLYICLLLLTTFYCIIHCFVSQSYTGCELSNSRKPGGSIYSVTFIMQRLRDWKYMPACFWAIVLVCHYYMFVLCRSTILRRSYVHFWWEERKQMMSARLSNSGCAGYTLSYILQQMVPFYPFSPFCK